MAKWSNEFLKRTIQMWQPDNFTFLTLEDAIEIVENVTNLFSLLDKLDTKYKDDKNDKK